MNDFQKKITVREIAAPFRGGALSGLLAEPVVESRATIVAFHGSGMSSRYFHATSHQRSLLMSAAMNGVTTIALDRPGYGLSREHFSTGLPVLDQAEVIEQALVSILQGTTPGVALYGHSFGAKVAMVLAEHCNQIQVNNLDICGLGMTYAVNPKQILSRNTRETAYLHWGSLKSYPPGTFAEAARSIVEPVSAVEFLEASQWEQQFRALAPNITCPTHFTFGEDERLWRCCKTDRERMCGHFQSSLASHSSLPNCGHNVSLSHAASIHHEEVVQRAIAHSDH